MALLTQVLLVICDEPSNNSAPNGVDSSDGAKGCVWSQRSI